MCPFWTLFELRMMEMVLTTWDQQDVQSSSPIFTINKPTHSTLQAGCPPRRPTNSVRALKGWDSLKICSEFNAVKRCSIFLISESAEPLTCGTRTFGTFLEQLCRLGGPELQGDHACCCRKWDYGPPQEVETLPKGPPGNNSNISDDSDRTRQQTRSEHRNGIVWQFQRS